MKGLAFVFPGQGSQVVGMGRSFWNDFTIAKRLFEEASDAIHLDVKKLCWDSPIHELTQTQNAQPAILTVSVIAYQVYLQEIGEKPHYAAGHSVGEYAALVCAGVIPFQDAVRLVRQRGVLMQHADPQQVGTMVAVTDIPAQALRKICAEISTDHYPVDIACLNSERQHVVAGHRQAVGHVVKQAERLGAKHTHLNVSAAFHSPMMIPAAEQFPDHLQSLTFADAEWPIISNVTAAPYQSGNSVAEHLQQQLTMPVRWLESMNYMLGHGILEIIEMGPKNVLSTLIRKITTHAAAYSLSQPSDLLSLSNSFERQKTLIRLRKKIFQDLTVKSIIARNYNEDTNAYSQRVTPLFAQLKLAAERINTNDMECSEEELDQSIRICKLILEAKQAPPQEAANLRS
ncbi:ACP S-malonyltransferase [Paenibacillus sp. MZ04-78.2]|uniref:ACP S-malonyltransferase n=1 Tax=Paenibacillus sp. MZ04-78.2 TaxID=2962034 RepID=UPI0020B641B0|nr:ACP S-malonyltransferase [Paenibacillus sp. MZ04-78.2]MCP3774855.1 ACP S-malonyltransferase [Paenibacillus sp. MZ04-78.2]